MAVQSSIVLVNQLDVVIIFLFNLFLLSDLSPIARWSHVLYSCCGLRRIPIFELSSDLGELIILTEFCEVWRNIDRLL